METKIPIKYLDELDDQEKKRSHTPEDHNIYISGQRRGFCKGYRKAEQETKERAIYAFKDFVDNYCSEAGHYNISDNAEHYIDKFKEKINE